jgi:Right handed beta helix region
VHRPTSLSEALLHAQTGSVVCLRAGTYATPQIIWLNHSGTPRAPITLRSYGGAALIKVVGTSARYPTGGVLETESGDNWSGAHDIVIDGLTIDGNNYLAAGITLTPGSHHITIRNCVIRNTGAAGIELNAVDYVSVLHTQIYRVGYNQGWGSGISLWYGGLLTPKYGGTTAWYDRRAGFHNFIVDNVISGTYDNSPHHTDGNGIVVDGNGPIPPALIANNLTYENGGRGIVSFANSGQMWIVNNTAYENGLDLQVSGGQASEFSANLSSAVHWINNLAYAHGVGGIYGAVGVTYRNVQSNVAWARNIGYNGTVLVTAVPGGRAFRYTNPRFANPPRLPPTSAPWYYAVPPWQIGKAFDLLPGSPARTYGVDPQKVNGMTPALRAGLNASLPAGLH